MIGEVHNAAEATGGFTRGSIPMWGTFAVVIGTLIVRITPLFEVWRRLTMSANDKLIADLQADGVALRAELREVREASALDRKTCREENDSLRRQVDEQHAEISKLQDDLLGLRRQVALQQAERIVTMTGSPSAEIVAAAARLAKLP